jgi:RNA polymerase sigma-70 factor (ECF subfamily)
MRFLETFTDIELIDHFRHGDEKAFRILYKRYQQKIFETIVFYVKDRTLAEDLSQEVYIKIISSIQANRYCDEGKFLPWALRIVHNHCMDHLRKRNRIAYVSDFTNTMLVNTATTSPETALMQEQAAAYLHLLVDKLSDEQKKVVRYRHFEELSFKEISKLTNSSVNTTLGRMRYAMMHLRAMVQNHPAHS